MAYRTDIIQRDGSFCDEYRRPWMDIEWNQLEIGEFSSDSTKASGCRSTPTMGPRVRWGGGSENLWNQAKRTALFVELSRAMRTEELFFSRDLPILKHTNRNFEPSLQILPCLEWHDACLLV